METRVRWITAGVTVAVLAAAAGGGVAWGSERARVDEAQSAYEVAVDGQKKALEEQADAVQARADVRASAAVALTEHAARAGVVEMLGEAGADVSSAAGNLTQLAGETYAVVVLQVAIPEVAREASVDELLEATEQANSARKRLEIRVAELEEPTTALDAAIAELRDRWVEVAPVPTEVTPSLVEGTPDGERAVAIAAAGAIKTTVPELTVDGTKTWNDWVLSVSAASAAKAAAEEAAAEAARQAAAAEQARQRQSTGGGTSNRGSTSGGSPGGGGGSGGSGSSSGGGMGPPMNTPPCNGCWEGADPGV